MTEIQTTGLESTAYCHPCGDVVDVDRRGCIPCAERKERSMTNRLAAILYWANVTTRKVLS